MEKENSTPKEEFKFFSRVKKAIFNLEKYSDFAKENIKFAIKYVLYLIIVLSVTEIVIYSVQANNLLNKVVNYVKEDLPAYSYDKPDLNAESAKTAYDEEYDFYFAIDTKNDEAIDGYRDEMKKHSIGLVLAKEEAFVYSNGEEFCYTYATLTEGFAVENFNTKDNLVENIEKNKTTIVIYGALVIFVTYIINYILLYASQLLAIALMVYLTGKIVGVKLDYKSSFNIAVYSTTLSTLLTVVYALTSAFTSFQIVNFDLMYNIIIYIYAVCAVIMLKIDETKQKEEIEKEVKKIEEVQAEVHNELEEAKKAEKEAIDTAENEETKKEEIIEEKVEETENIENKNDVEKEENKDAEEIEKSEKVENKEKSSSKKSKAKKSKKKDA